MQMVRWISWNSPLQFILYARSCRVWPFRKCYQLVWRLIQESLDQQQLHQFNMQLSNSNLLLLIPARLLRLQKQLHRHKLPKARRQLLFVLLHSVRCCLLVWLLRCTEFAFLCEMHVGMAVSVQSDEVVFFLLIYAWCCFPRWWCGY